MKKSIFIAVLLLVSVLLMTGCENHVDNSLTFRNLASNDIHINFRAALITVRAGSSVNIIEMVCLCIGRYF